MKYMHIPGIPRTCLCIEGLVTKTTVTGHKMGLRNLWINDGLVTNFSVLLVYFESNERVWGCKCPIFVKRNLRNEAADHVICSYVMLCGVYSLQVMLMSRCLRWTCNSTTLPCRVVTCHDTLCHLVPVQHGWNGRCCFSSAVSSCWPVYLLIIWALLPYNVWSISS